MTVMQAALAKFGSRELAGLIEETSYNPALVDLLVRVGDTLKSDSLVTGLGAPLSTTSPRAALKEIKRLESDQEFMVKLGNKSHAGRSEAVGRMEELYKIAYDARGWGKKSEKLVGKKSGKYYERTNIIAGLVNNQSIAPMVFNGTCNTNLFETWVEKFLIKELKLGQVVIMDNASFHKSQKTRELIESVGCKIIFLPPYSPDLNPIEKLWANMKQWLEYNIVNFTELYDSISWFFKISNST
jgi:transposase